MKKKSFANKSKRSGGDALRADVVSANEYTGFVQHIPVTNEDIELYKQTLLERNGRKDKFRNQSEGRTFRHGCGGHTIQGYVRADKQQH